MGRRSQFQNQVLHIVSFKAIILWKIKTGKIPLKIKSRDSLNKSSLMLYSIISGLFSSELVFPKQIKLSSSTFYNSGDYLNKMNRFIGLFLVCVTCITVYICFRALFDILGRKIQAEHSLRVLIKDSLRRAVTKKPKSRHV